jgi:hypothetical protein
MVKLIAIIITISLLITAVPAFAQQGGGREKSLFQIAKDSMDEAYRIREKKPWGDIEIFEDVQNELSDLDNRSAAAKNFSLRGNEEELARRRAIR